MFQTPSLFHMAKDEPFSPNHIWVCDLNLQAHRSVATSTALQMMRFLT